MGYIYEIKHIYNKFSFPRAAKSISRPFPHYHSFLSHNNLYKLSRTLISIMMKKPKQIVEIVLNLTNYIKGISKDDVMTL